MLLFYDADLAAAILCPGGFVGGGIGRHFRAEADRLDFLRVGAVGDEGFADRLGATFAQAAIVLRRAAFVGKAGDNDLGGALLEEARDLLNLAILRGADGLAVEVEINRLELL